MTSENEGKGSNLPRIILFLLLGMLVAGVTLQGIGVVQIQRLWDHVLARPSDETLALRFILQPAVSTIFAVRDGIRDARTGRSPYFWTIVSEPEKRRARLREGALATGKIILLAILLDVIYQYITYKTIYPVEALVVAILLAFIPYFIIRGPVERVAHWYLSR